MHVRDMRGLALRWGLGVLLLVCATPFLHADESFLALPRARRAELVHYAKCARAAYPGEAIPKGLRPFTETEWKDCVLGQSYAGCTYSPDGFLNVGTGLRARLMVSTTSDDVVVAWSGCDLGPSQIKSGGRDVIAVLKQMAGSLDGQYSQASHLFEGVLLGTRGHVTVVGHSLGGGLTTYVVASAGDTQDRVSGFTFNGLGFSEKALGRHMTPLRRQRAEELLVNVKGSRELLFRLKNMAGLPASHFGKVYEVPEELLSDWHGINNLIEQMEKSLAAKAGGDDMNQVE